MIVGEREPRIAKWSPLQASRKVQMYYKHRDMPKVDYDEYWREKVDPDGKVIDPFGDEQRDKHLELVAEEIEFIRGLPSGMLLDVGCGPGWLLHQVAKHHAAFGVEPAIQASKEAYRQHVKDVYRDLFKPHFADRVFDTVVCHHVIEHVEDPIDFIHEIHRIMKRGAWLIIGTPDFASPCALRFGDNYRMLHDPGHISLFTRESMSRLLRDKGFTIEKMSYPFPESWATPENFARWNDTTKVSPPWPGNWVTWYARKD